MSTYEVGPGKPVMPSVGFLYGSNGEVVGEATPTTRPVAEAFINGGITPEEYVKLREEETAANQRLRDFMYGDQSPDFMPRIPRVSRWRGWLKSMVS